jgi:hypothetical protein
MTKLEQSLKDRDLIDIGDKVRVGLYTTQYGSEYFDAEVRYKPQATGDCWIFIDSFENIRYVQNYMEIIKYKEIPKNNNNYLPF